VTKTRPRHRSTRQEELPAAASSLRYIESSTVVAALLEHDVEAIAALREIGRRITSALTFAEAGRALRRARAAQRISANEERAVLRDLGALERRCTAVLAVTPDVLARARRPFPVEPIRTLDAIHLATIESMDETPQLVTVVTRDDRIARNARALGYYVV